MARMAMPCPNGRFRACGLRGDGKVLRTYTRSPVGLAAHPPHAAHSFSVFHAPEILSCEALQMKMYMHMYMY